MRLRSRQYYMKRVVIFREKHPLLGPIFWMLSVQYFLVQIVVAAAWKVPFSLMRNTISDLGNTVCAPFSDRIVCSPLHGLMNASFIVFGVTMVVGSFFITSEFRKNAWSRAGFFGMGLAGLGTVLVGIFPENTVGTMHIIGAVLPFFVGNLSLVILSHSLQLPPGFRAYTRASGYVALIALVLFTLNHYIGFGLGGLERLVSYPQALWLIAFGCYISLDHYRQMQNGKIIYR